MTGERRVPSELKFRLNSHLGVRCVCPTNKGGRQHADFAADARKGRATLSNISATSCYAESRTAASQAPPATGRRRSQQIDEPTCGKGFGGLRPGRPRRRIAGV